MASPQHERRPRSSSAWGGLSSLLHTAALLFRTHLPRIARSRRVLLMGLVAAAPPALVLLLGLSPRVQVERAVREIAWVLLLQVSVPLVPLIGAGAVVAEEVADRTIVYVLTRPVSRAGFLLGRWGAVALVVVVLLLASVLGMFLVARAFGASLPAGSLSRVLVASALGGAVYTALFAVVGAVFRHGMIVGIAYAFAIEALLANLPGEFQGLAVQHYLRASMLDAGGGGPWEKLAMLHPLMEYPPASEARTTLVLILLVALVLGCVLVSRKQYVLRS